MLERRACLPDIGFGLKRRELRQCFIGHGSRHLASILGDDGGLAAVDNSVDDIREIPARRRDAELFGLLAQRQACGSRSGCLVHSGRSIFARTSLILYNVYTLYAFVNSGWNAQRAVIRGWHRQRLLVKAAREADLQGYLRAWLDDAEQPRGSVKLHVDVDPYSFL